MIANSNKKKPKASVLICASNSAKYIEETINSIINQTFTDFEIIIVENGSIDNTLDIIKSFNDIRIKLFSTSLRQIPFNLNFGLLHCNGEYILRIDADDIAYPTRFEKQINFLENNLDVDVLGTSMELFGDANGMKTYPCEHATIVRNMAFTTTLANPTVAIRASALAKVNGYFGLKYAEDLDLWLSLARTGSKFANMIEPLTKYRIHETQTRGKLEAYASAAAVILKHGLMTRDIIFILGSVYSAAKITRAK